MVATLSSDGSWLSPLYLKSQSKSASKASGRRVEASAQPLRGMNNLSMKVWADSLDSNVEEPTRLLMDRLSSHTSREVRNYIEAKRCKDGRQKFKVMLLPPKGAFLVSPLDNGFFSYWKSKFYKFDRSTFPLKMAAAKETWKLVDSEDVVAFFRGCYLTGKKREDTLRRELLELVDATIPEELQEHADYHEAWANGSFTVDGISAPRAIPFERPTLPEDDALDGVYWREWGAHGMKP